MPLIRSLLALGAVLAAGLVACDRDTPEPANDTPALLPPAEVMPPLTAPAAPSWNGWPVERAGELLVVPAAGTALRAQLVLPRLTDSTLTPTTAFDLAPLDDVEVELFSPAGLVGRATLQAPEQPGRAAGREGCTAWPAARVLPAAEPVTPWTVALAAGQAEAIPLDSVTALPRADSARLAAAVALAASLLPQDTASVFRGLPFVVRSVRRFTPVEGREAFVADVMRRVNLEASQQAENIFLVGERAAGATRASYQPVYVERSTGPEETLELREVLAALRIGDGGGAGRPALVVARDYGDGTAYSLVERGADGRWRARWSSAYAGC